MSGRSSIVSMDALESRRLFTASLAVGVNFNDEALWDKNFDTAVAQAKALGVQTVRLWMGFNNYEDRPNAWDPVPPFGTLLPGEVATSVPQQLRLQLEMKRAFDLKRAGFNVLAVLNNNYGNAPTSASQVTGLMQYLINAPDLPGSSFTLGQAIDSWEVGNEPDSSTFWKPSATSKTTGLKSYVDDFLIPAAQVLKAGGERVISAGVSYSPTDMKAILDELTAKNALSLIDSVGFHPYGAYDPNNPSNNPILSATNAAVYYAKQVGKTVTATEWNIRGYGTSGASDATWAKAADQIYRNVILPNYDANYYFCLINNWAGRGGTTSARPGGLLKHTTDLDTVPSSSIAKLQSYYESPLVAAEPFYSMFKAWQSIGQPTTPAATGSVSGTVTNQTAGAAVPAMKVYIDVNKNSILDATEPSATTASNGTYTLSYSASVVPNGTYTMRLQLPTGTTGIMGSITRTLTTAVATTGANFTIKTTGNVPSGVTTGSISGVLWQDDQNKAAPAGWRVFADLNGNGVLDGVEPSGLTTSTGAYTVAFNTAVTGVAAGVLKVSSPTGYVATTTVPVTLTPGLTQTGKNFGVRKIVAALGSISGYLWSDNNKNSIFDTGDTRLASRVVFLDANANNKLDAGEKQTTSDTNGNYSFTGLAAGTYYVTRVFPTGFKIVGGVNGHITVALTAGKVVTGVNIGAKASA
ncbi:MAG: Cna B-type [Phycisphaerales bacterium]|nr:Cna B-type [Phycisphaerales bacterium]